MGELQQKETSPLLHVHLQAIGMLVADKRGRWTSYSANAHYMSCDDTIGNDTIGNDTIGNDTKKGEKKSSSSPQVDNTGDACQQTNHNRKIVCNIAMRPINGAT